MSLINNFLLNSALTSRKLLFSDLTVRNIKLRKVKDYIIHSYVCSVIQSNSLSTRISSQTSDNQLSISLNRKETILRNRISNACPISKSDQSLVGSRKKLANYGPVQYERRVERGRGRERTTIFEARFQFRQCVRACTASGRPGRLCLLCTLGARSPGLSSI